MSNFTSWKADLQKYVGRSFDCTYNDKTAKMLLKQLIGEETTKSATFELVGGGGYGAMLAYNGNDLNYARDKRAFRFLIEPHEYSLSDIITRKQANTDMSKNSSAERVGKKLGRSAAITPYIHLLQLFASAYDEAKTWGDGKSWAATDHPVAAKEDATASRIRVVDEESGTFSNKIDDKLDIDAIKKARAMGSRFITPDGQPLFANYNVLLVSPELEGTAKELLGDFSAAKPTKNPGNNTNAASPIADMTWYVVGAGSEGFSATQWAVADADMLKETVKLIWTEKPQVLENDLDNPLKAQFTAYADFALGVGDARGIIFSDGSGA